MNTINRDRWRKYWTNNFVLPKNEKKLPRIINKYYLVRADKHPWAIENILSKEEAILAKDLWPNSHYYIIRAKDEYQANWKVFSRFAGKTPILYCNGCINSPTDKRYIYHILPVPTQSVIELTEEEYKRKKNDNVFNNQPLHNLITLKLEKARTEPRYRPNPKLVKKHKAYRVTVTKNIPEFYKDKMISLFNTEYKKSIRIRSSEYYEEDSIYITNENWIKVQRRVTETKEPIYSSPIPKPQHVKKFGKFNKACPRKLKNKKSLRYKHTRENNGITIIFKRNAILPITSWTKCIKKHKNQQNDKN